MRTKQGARYWTLSDYIVFKEFNPIYHNTAHDRHKTSQYLISVLTYRWKNTVHLDSLSTEFAWENISIFCSVFCDQNMKTCSGRTQQAKGALKYQLFCCTGLKCKAFSQPGTENFKILSFPPVIKLGLFLYLRNLLLNPLDWILFLIFKISS